MKNIHDNSEERQLLARLIRGDMAGYEVLFHRYYPTFFTFIKGMTKDSALSEDIAQNIFMKVWINRETLDAEKSIRNYLFVLAKYEVYNYFRSKSRLVVPIDSGVEVKAPQFNDTYETIALKETIDIVEDIVNRMPPRRQNIFRMSRFKHIPNKEIADELNLSVRTVEKHLELAIRELRTHLPTSAAILAFFDFFFAYNLF